MSTIRLKYLHPIWLEMDECFQFTTFFKHKIEKKHEYKK